MIFLEFLFESYSEFRYLKKLGQLRYKTRFVLKKNFLLFYNARL